MADLRIDGICRGWDFPVLDEISIEVTEGEFFVLVGPSGAGKTTLLRLVAGLDTPDQGKIFFSGKDVTRVPPYRRGAAMTFESYALYPLLSVYDNIASPLRARNLPEDKIREQVQHVTELLRISELLERRPGEISGGQKQRTALGRTLVATPEVFLLDEPLSHLDAKIRVDLREQFHTLEELRRTATLYVTHDYAEALSLADRVGVLSDSKILQIGTPTEIFERPVSVKVASQFGQPGINLVPVSLQSSEGNLTACAGEFKIPVVPSQRATVAAAGNAGLRLGIRPQHLRVDPAGEINGKVTGFQSLGSYGVLNATCGEVPLKVLATADSTLQPGDQIKLSAETESCIWFGSNDMALVE